MDNSIVLVNMTARLQALLDFFNAVAADDFLALVLDQQVKLGKGLVFLKAFQKARTPVQVNEMQFYVRTGFFKHEYRSWESLPLYAKTKIVRGAEALQAAVGPQLIVARELVKKLQLFGAMELFMKDEEFWRDRPYFIEFSGSGRFHRDGFLIIKDQESGTKIFEFQNAFMSYQPPLYRGKDWSSCSISELLFFLTELDVVYESLQSELATR